MTAPMFCGRPVRGVVLDLDGTLINTTVDFRLMKRRVMYELAARRIPTSVLDSAATIADNIERATEHLVRTGREDEIGPMLRSLVQVMNGTELERVRETTAVKGAGECLTRLRDAGLRIGLLTRGSRDYATAALRYAGLDHRFDAMICRDDFPEKEAKPNGLAMVRMASILGLRPEDCVLVGDHAMDLSCARSVSAGFVGVLTGSFGREQWYHSKCEVVIESVVSLPDLLLGQKPY